MYVGLMAVEVDVVRFHRPESREHCLFVANIPTFLSREERWSCLDAAFSPFGLIYQIQLPENLELNYGFVKFYSEFACQCAQRALNQHLTVGDQVVRVLSSKERSPSSTAPLHITNCQKLANHYLGFNGWSTLVRSLEQHSQTEYTCEAVIHVRGWEVESVGRGKVTVELENDVEARVRAIGSAKKQVLNRACEDAFSRVVLAVVQPGDRLASVTVIGKQEIDEHIDTPIVNVLPAGTYQDDEHMNTNTE